MNRRCCHDPRRRLTGLRRGVIALTACVAFTAQGDVSSSLPLPQWSPDELEALERQGGPPGLGILLPRDATFLQPLGEPVDFMHSGPRLADGPPNVFPEGGGLLAQDMSLFLPDSILRSYQAAHPASGSPTPTTSLRAVPPE